jgi:hypothetical protein
MKSNLFKTVLNKRHHFKPYLYKIGGLEDERLVSAK